MIRAYIHKAGGHITIADCRRYSNALSDYLDTEDVIPGRYTLEVSSVGLDRPLLKDRDFQRRVGEEISLELQPGSFSKNTVRGKLLSADKSGIDISCNNENLHFDYSRIIRAKIIY